MKFLDLTVPVRKAKWEAIFSAERMTAFGHLGTHFDVMNKEFPVDDLKRPGKLVEASGIRDRDIALADMADAAIDAGDFVIFHTGFLARTGYGTPQYFAEHPQLSPELIEHLLAKRVSLIGIDAAGLRRGKEHTPTDQACADQGVFVVENLANLETLHREAGTLPFTVYTFPLSFEGLTGLPCRVFAEYQ